MKVGLSCRHEGKKTEGIFAGDGSGEAARLPALLAASRRRARAGGGPCSASTGLE